MPGTLARIAADGGTDLKLAIAKHPNADATTLRALADNPDAYDYNVRAAVAGNSHTSAPMLALLLIAEIKYD